jgi:hypothetical protein
MSGIISRISTHGLPTVWSRCRSKALNLFHPSDLVFNYISETRLSFILYLFFLKKKTNLALFSVCYFLNSRKICNTFQKLNKLNGLLF